MNARLVTALVGLVASLAISAVIYVATGWIVVFIAIPFVPLLVRGLRDRDDAARTDAPSMRTCPECGFATADPDVRYCPRDGTELR